MASDGLHDVGILRVVFKEVSPGDLRKLRASSNDAPTGGGARDFRLPYRRFDPVMRKLLPRTREVQRRRNNEKVVVDLHWGPVKIRQDDDRITEVDLLWESPTDARPSEGRIPRVHDHFNVPEDGLGAVFFVLMQHKEHVLASYAYEEDLRNGHWNQELTHHILTCKDSPERRPKVLAQGYVDCVKPDRYYHGIDK